MTLSTAVVGGGVVSGRHLSGLAQMPQVDLVAVCDIDEQRASEQARKYDITAYTDMALLLDSEDLDWIHLCTPVQTHRDLAIQAIEAGVAVQIEKPATETVAELDEIEAAADEHGVTVTVVRNHLFDMAAVAAREKIESGKLGRVRGVDVIASGKTRPDDQNRGSWAFDLAGGEFEEGIPHQIYLALAMGGYPKRADDVHATTALSGTYKGGFTYDGLELQWVTGDEALCSVKLLAGATPQRTLIVHGEQASLAVDLLSQTVVTLDREYASSAMARAMSNVDHILGRVRGSVENAVGMIRRRFSDDWETEIKWNPHYRQFDEEANALLAGEEPTVSLSEVRWTVRMMELVREDATRRQSIPEQDDTAPGDTREPLAEDD
jgi:predicted dehydrogenase